MFLHTAVGDFQRSDDLGVSWTTIDDPAEAVGNQPNVMEGDRGIFVGAEP